MKHFGVCDYKVSSGTGLYTPLSFCKFLHVPPSKAFLTLPEFEVVEMYKW
jgi:hypothetical protein